jgi:hypothetical protein
MTKGDFDRRRSNVVAVAYKGLKLTAVPVLKEAVFSSEYVSYASGN